MPTTCWATNGLGKDLPKALIERALQAELPEPLGDEKHAADGRGSGNSRTGISAKTPTRPVRGDRAVPRSLRRCANKAGWWGNIRGVHYLSIRYTERLAEAGIASSVGSVGDSYDNALAETMIGLYKYRSDSTLRSLAACRARRICYPRMGRLV